MDEARFQFTRKSLLDLPPALPDKRMTYHDRGQQGLTVRVTDNGSKSFCVVGRVNSRMVRTTLGKFPRMTVEQARKAAKSVIAQHAVGVNPIVEERAQLADLAARTVETMTVTEVLDEYLALAGVRNSTAGAYKRVMKAVCDDWMNTPLLVLTPLMIRERHATYPSKAQANNACRVLEGTV